MGGVFKEVLELDIGRVRPSIEYELAEVARSIMRGEGLRYVLPTLSANNPLYVEELDRIVLKDKTSTRAFASGGRCGKWRL